MATEAKPMELGAPQQRQVNEFKLAEDSELRLEVGSSEVVVELLEGSAEIFGTPLALHKRYTLPAGYRGAIFTYKGAKVEVVGKTESAYVAQQTPMIIYLNTHAAMEGLRQKAEDELAKSNSLAHGPRLLVAGPMDVGKTTLCRILCNYAVRQGRTPIYVDLDVGQTSICTPGSIAALYVEKPADIVEGFDRKAITAYNFGFTSPDRNMALYDTLIRELALRVKRKAKEQRASNVGGVIINTCGWIKGDGYSSIITAAEAFEPDVIIVLDHERLYNQLVQDVPGFMKVLHLPKSGGVESRTREMRMASRQSAIHRNFYGTKSNPAFPHSCEISYDKPAEEQELLVAKVGAEKLPDSCLPFGMKPEDERTKVVPMPIGAELTHHLLALMPADSAIDQSLLKKPCLGYLVVSAVDTVNKVITLLSPQPYPLPSRVALFSEVMYLDDDRS